MQRKIFLLALSTLLFCTASGRDAFAETETETLDTDVIQTDREVKFFQDDSDAIVHLAPGTYRVEAIDGARIRLENQGDGKSVVLSAKSGRHDDELTASFAAIKVEDDDEFHVVLFRPDGSVLDAVGSLTGIIPRSGWQYPTRYSRRTYAARPRTPPRSRPTPGAQTARPARTAERIQPVAITYERSPVRLSSDIFSAERAQVARPAALSVTRRRELIQSARAAAAIPESLLAQLDPTPPVNVSLTPEVPASNDSYFSVWRGSHYPSGKGAVYTEDCPYAVGHAANHGMFILDLWTEAGKSYFLDSAISPGGVWIFTGGVNASVSAVDGHLTVAFRATSDRTEIRFYKRDFSTGGDGNNFLFYSAELTKID